MRYIKIITILWLSVASLFAYGEDKIAVIDMAFLRLLDLILLSIIFESLLNTELSLMNP